MPHDRDKLFDELKAINLVFNGLLFIIITISLFTDVKTNGQAQHFIALETTTTLFSSALNALCWIHKKQNRYLIMSGFSFLLFSASISLMP